MPCVPCSIDFYILALSFQNPSTSDWLEVYSTDQSLLFHQPKSMSYFVLGGQNCLAQSRAYFVSWLEILTAKCRSLFNRHSSGAEEDVTCEISHSVVLDVPAGPSISLKQPVVLMSCPLVCNSLMARWGWLHHVLCLPHPPPACGRGCSKTVMIQCAECQGTSVRPLIIECNQRSACEKGPCYYLMLYCVCLAGSSTKVCLFSAALSFNNQHRRYHSVCTCACAFLGTVTKRWRAINCVNLHYWLIDFQWSPLLPAISLPHASS